MKLKRKIEDIPEPPVSPGIRVTVMELSGLVTNTEMFEMRDQIQQGIEQGKINVLVDLGKVKHITLPGIPVFVQMAERLRARGGYLKIAGASEALLEILDLVGVRDRLVIGKDREQVLRCFR
jgi:anti-anti-sigma factor